MAKEKKKESFNKKISRFATKGFVIGKVGVAKTLYANRKPAVFIGSQYQNKQVGNLTPTGGIKTGRRGRPRGSFDQRYARYGGVYGYREALRKQRRQQSMRFKESIALNPRQKIALANIKSRERFQEERRRAGTFPDTSGEMNIGDFTGNINRFANMVD